jgi:hypothetical protein
VQVQAVAVVVAVAVTVVVAVTVTVAVTVAVAVAVVLAVALAVAVAVVVAVGMAVTATVAVVVVVTVGMAVEVEVTVMQHRLGSVMTSTLIGQRGVSTVQAGRTAVPVSRPALAVRVCLVGRVAVVPTLGPGPAPSLVRVTAHALQLAQVVQVAATRGGLRLFTLTCDGRMRAPVTSC